MIYPFLIAGAYLLGSIPFGYLFCLVFKGIDIRTCGSGNTGATNVYRVAGWPLALSVLLLDMAKGAVPVIAAKILHVPPLLLISSGVAAIAGHSFSVFLKGGGGKGVATSFGAVTALFPLPALLALAVWILTTAVTGYVSVGSIAASFSLPFFIFFISGNIAFTATGSIIFLLILFTHRSNIIRLAQKKENKIIPPWNKK